MADAESWKINGHPDRWKPKDTEQLNINGDFPPSNTIGLNLNILQGPHPEICKTVLMSFYIWDLSIRKFWHLWGSLNKLPAKIPRDYCIIKLSKVIDRITNSILRMEETTTLKRKKNICNQSN